MHILAHHEHFFAGSLQHFTKDSRQENAAFGVCLSFYIT
jgi:hypothetical protein